MKNKTVLLAQVGDMRYTACRYKHGWVVMRHLGIDDSHIWVLIRGDSYDEWQWMQVKREMRDGEWSVCMAGLPAHIFKSQKAISKTINKETYDAYERGD